MAIMPKENHSMNRLSRRDFYAAGAGVLAAATWGKLAVAKSGDQAEGSQPFGLNYIVSAAMYGDAPLSVVLSQVKQAGADSVDIWSKPHGPQRDEIDQIGHEEVAKLLKNHGVRWAASSRYDLKPGGLGDEIATLGKFDGEQLITASRRQPGATVKEQVRNCVESFKRDLEQAENHGITIGVENHSGMALNTPDSLRYFAEFADSPRLGIALAPYHLPQNPQEIATLINDIGHKLVFFQAWQFGNGCMEKLPNDQELMQLPGKGDLDFEPILGALQKINYSGKTEIFMHPFPRGLPIRETAQLVTEEINRSREYLDKRLAAIVTN